MIDPKPADLIRSLASNLCPACGAKKRERQSVCGGCWKELPRGIRASLYDLVGGGYEEAFASAMKHLGVTDLDIEGGNP